MDFLRCSFLNTKSKSSSCLSRLVSLSYFKHIIKAAIEIHLRLLINSLVQNIKTRFVLFRFQGSWTVNPAQWNSSAKIFGPKSHFYQTGGQKFSLVCSHIEIAQCLSTKSLKERWSKTSLLVTPYICDCQYDTIKQDIYLCRVSIWFNVRVVFN